MTDHDSTPDTAAYSEDVLLRVFEQFEELAFEHLQDTHDSALAERADRAFAELCLHVAEQQAEIARERVSHGDEIITAELVQDALNDELTPENRP